MTAPLSPLLPVYSPPDLIFERGEGPYLFTKTGARYLDFISGIAVTALGHGHPHLVAALKAQADKLWHLSNMFLVEDQLRLAQRYVDATFADQVFFTNSGTEAIEGALKMARRYHFAKGAPERFVVLTFEGAFHGRSYGAVNAGGNPTYLEGFGPRLPGYRQLPFGDHAALEAAAAEPDVCAILIEPVQGEGGLREVPGVCLQGLRRLADAHDLLLIYDEVQCGAGRTGKLFAHQWTDGAEPDVMAVAKGVGGGFPMGAVLANLRGASGMARGVHGTTFGGNPLAMAVGNAVMDVMLTEGFFDNVNARANELAQGLAGLKDLYPDLVLEVRGKGLLRGLRLARDPKPVQAAARERGLLCGVAGQNTLRLAPPLLMEAAHVSAALGVIDAALAAETKAKAA